MVSERDILTKVSFYEKDPLKVKVYDVCTKAANLVNVRLNDPIERCMQKMLARDIRHLLIMEDNSDTVVGMISIKDVVKCTLAKSDATVERLEVIAQTQDMLRYQL